MNLKKILALLIALMMIIPVQSVFAYEDDDQNVSIEFIDITGGYEKGAPALSGEAKILVRAVGLEGMATIAQTAVLFSGNLKYRGIQYLIGEDKYPECYLIHPDAAYANFTKEVIPAVVTNSEYTVPFNKDGTDMFILTFYGEPGESIDLRLSLADTYFVFGDEEIKPSEAVSGKGIASESETERCSAIVRLTMDKVTTFAQSTDEGYADTGIELSITDEEHNYTLNTVLNNVLTGDGGHRDGTKLVPTFEVVMDITKGNTYTVELSAMGYVTFVKTGVTFETPLELTNKDFIPGDIDGNGEVNETDKQICLEAVEDVSLSDKYQWATDINRDGVVNNNDLLSFEALDEPEEDDKEDNKDDNKDDKEDNDKNDKDDDDDKKGSGSSGGGGGGGGGGSFSPVVSTPQIQPQNPGQNGDRFADLAGFEWAETAIYTLKNTGIINGTAPSVFSPAQNIKRGDFILILSRMIDFGQMDSEGFSDVPSSSYYHLAISKAKRAGIAKGSGNEFYPENSITRQDLITLAYRAFLNAGYISEVTDFSSLDQFADKSAIADYAVAPLASMVSAGIIKGSDGMVNPNGNATRAEVAVMCERLLKLK